MTRNEAESVVVGDRVCSPEGAVCEVSGIEHESALDGVTIITATLVPEHPLEVGLRSANLEECILLEKSPSENKQRL